MSAYKIRKPRNYREESIKHSEQGESLKSRMSKFACSSRLQLLNSRTRLRVSLYSSTPCSCKTQLRMVIHGAVFHGALESEGM
jgi:hypothetical protein